jgi:hypothetical protein
VSRPSTILICPMVQLRTLPPMERDTLRRFFTEHVVGMDRRNHDAWMRFIRDLFNAEPGEGFQLARFAERSGPYHRMHRKVLARLFDSQEHFPNPDVLHDWLKLKCWFVEWIDGKPKPRSTAFDKCCEDDIRWFHRQMEELMQVPWCQRFFWPHIPPAKRHEMTDFVLNGNAQEEDETR